jgi:hypothetical protein
VCVCALSAGGWWFDWVLCQHRSCLLKAAPAGTRALHPQPARPHTC